MEADAAGAPDDLGTPNWMGVRRLYPLYMRGRAYLAAHQAASAAEAFQKILYHPGSVVNEPIGALAHLGLGRAYAMTGAYQDFLALRKDAGPDVPRRTIFLGRRTVEKKARGQPGGEFRSQISSLSEKLQTRW